MGIWTGYFLFLLSIIAFCNGTNVSYACIMGHLVQRQPPPDQIFNKSMTFYGIKMESQRAFATSVACQHKTLTLPHI